MSQFLNLTFDWFSFFILAFPTHWWDNKSFVSFNVCWQEPWSSYEICTQKKTRWKHKKVKKRFLIHNEIVLLEFVMKTLIFNSYVIILFILIFLLANEQYNVQPLNLQLFEQQFNSLVRCMAYGVCSLHRYTLWFHLNKLNYF